jgi:serine/threonine protein kinase
MVGQAAREAKPRYETLFRLAAGGMATVYVGTVRGALGFRQLVAIKKPHAHLLLDKEFRQQFVTEARLASLIHHANVVDVRDVEANDDEVSLVMDYVEGASLGELLQQAVEGPRVSPGVAVRIALDACAGLQAAHDITDERGRPLHLVHRDISPQNLLVGIDGVTRVADFGVAKFDKKAGASTTDGNLKGKLAYMAPEYLHGGSIDRRMDIFAMGIVLWEALTGSRLFRGQHEADTMQRVLKHAAPPISEVVPGVGTALDAIVETALSKSRDDRFDNAAAMANALESSAREAGLLASHREVAALVEAAVGQRLKERRETIRARLANEPSVASGLVDSAPRTPEEVVSSAPPTEKVPPSSATVVEGRREPGSAPAVEPIAATTLHSEGWQGAVALPVEPSLPTADVAASPQRRTHYLALAFLVGLLVAGGVAFLARRGPTTPAAAAAGSAPVVATQSIPPAASIPSEPPTTAPVTPPLGPSAASAPAASDSPAAGPPPAAPAHPTRAPSSKTPPAASATVHVRDPAPNPYAP